MPLQELESTKTEIESQLNATPPPTRPVPDVEKLLRERVKTLEDLLRVADPELIEQARSSVKAMLGEVKVFEDASGVYAEVDLGRAYITNGAEERT